MSYSQYHEEKIIGDFFAGRVGNFMDVGAFDGKNNSNVLALAERNWGGVCVEPSPRVFPYLVDTHAGNDRVKCLNAAVDGESAIKPFWDANGDQLATVELSHRDIWIQRGYPYNPGFYVCTVTFTQILAAFPGPFHFLSIDVEGTNLRVLKAAPLDAMGVELVCVEKEPGEAMVEHLRAVGFTNIRETAGNWLASR